MLNPQRRPAGPPTLQGHETRVYHDDDLVTLASLDPDLTVDGLISEFGLIPHAAYIERAQKAQDVLRRAAASTGEGGSLTAC